MKPEKECTSIQAVLEPINGLGIDSVSAMEGIIHTPDTALYQSQSKFLQPLLNDRANECLNEHSAAISNGDDHRPEKVQNSWPLNSNRALKFQNSVNLSPNLASNRRSPETSGEVSPSVCLKRNVSPSQMEIFHFETDMSPALDREDSATFRFNFSKYPGPSSTPVQSPRVLEHFGAPESPTSPPSRPSSADCTLQTEYLERLQELIPWVPNDEQMPKLQLVQAVIDYIGMLQDELACGGSNAMSPNPMDGTRICQFDACTEDMMSSTPPVMEEAFSSYRCSAEFACRQNLQQESASDIIDEGCMASFSSSRDESCDIGSCTPPSPSPQADLHSPSSQNTFTGNSTAAPAHLFHAPANTDDVIASRAQILNFPTNGLYPHHNNVCSQHFRFEEEHPESFKTKQLVDEPGANLPELQLMMTTTTRSTSEYNDRQSLLSSSCNFGVVASQTFATEQISCGAEDAATRATGDQLTDSVHGAVMHMVLVNGENEHADTNIKNNKALRPEEGRLQQEQELMNDMQLLTMRDISLQRSPRQLQRPRQMVDSNPPSREHSSYADCIHQCKADENSIVSSVESVRQNRLNGFCLASTNSVYDYVQNNCLYGGLARCSSASLEGSEYEQPIIFPFPPPPSPQTIKAVRKKKMLLKRQQQQQHEQMLLELHL